MAKRGRKPNPNKNKNYFSENEEAAVVEYLNTEDKEERDRIFNTKLYAPFTKMVESIIRRYKLHVPDETSGETFNDAMAFIMLKADKFEPGKYKAYSYYGTVCKNYIIGRIQNYYKDLEKNRVYEDAVAELRENMNYSDYVDKNTRIAKESVDIMSEKIDTMLENPDKYKLRPNEIKMGNALKTLFDNWEWVLSTDGSNKLNKNAILFFLREATGFDTKGVRDNMKKYKTLFYEVKKSLI